MSGKTGATIQKIRKSLGFTQTEVAERLFTTPQNISRVESGEGEPTVEMLIGLSELFGVSVDTLLCRDVLSEAELLKRVRDRMQRASREETSETVFCVCKAMLYGRYAASLGEEKEISDRPTYSTIRTRALTGVFSDRLERPPIFAAVGANAVDLCEASERSLAGIFEALADREVLRIINKLSDLFPYDKSYDKSSFCSAFGVEESKFERLFERLATLQLITARTVNLNGSAVTVYRPALSGEVVLLLSLADLLYNASPDGNAH